MRDEFCSACGTQYAQAQLVWPRHCTSCQQETWKNPLPVVVCMVPVMQDPLTETQSMILIRRGIPPHIGQLALPGGYIEAHESWQQAASRELKEETGVSVAAGSFMLWDVESSTSNAKLLIFALAPPQPNSIVQDFSPSAETTEIILASTPQELCFSMHSKHLKTWVYQHPHW